jgi:hypothetical protein
MGIPKEAKTAKTVCWRNNLTFMVLGRMGRHHELRELEKCCQLPVRVFASLRYTTIHFLADHKYYSMDVFKNADVGAFSDHYAFAI